MKSFLRFGVWAAVSFFAIPGFAQKLVDPNAVAPEYRAAAEKRKAEQLRQRECSLKADLAKAKPRDRTEFIIHCLDGTGEK